MQKEVTVIKDSKRYICTLVEVAVRGGKQVAYIAEDGTVLKTESLYRYKERIKRRKGDTGYAIRA